MPNHFLIHELLTREELDQLETFAREPACTHEAVAQWLLERGFNVSKSSVGRWKLNFDQSEKMSRARSIARAQMMGLEAANGDGPSRVSEATLLNIEQGLFERSLSADQEEPGELLKLAMAAKTLSQTRSENIDLKEKVKTLEAKQKAMVEAAEKAGKAGIDPVAAIKKVLLGI